MPSLDLSRWGLFARSDDSGFGRMSMMIKSSLGITRHIGIPSDRLEDVPLNGPRESWLRPDEPIERVLEELDGLQGIIFFEHCGWHPKMLEAAERAGVKTVCVPMWEWFSGHKPEWARVDWIACPTQWTVSVVRSYGYDRCSHITWPVDLSHLPSREIEGTARLFVHNAGLVDLQDRKGTADTIRAFRKVKNPEIRLVVRMQKEAKMPALDDRIQLQVGNIADFSELYREGDVAIQPSKMEGLGFMVIEPSVCGIPTITTDYPPMNEFVTDRRLLVKPQWGKRRAFPSAWIKHAHLRIPQTGDLARKIAWCADNDLSEISRQSRVAAVERYDPAKVVAAWTTMLERLVT